MLWRCLVDQLLSNLPALIALLAVLAFLVYTGVRVGPSFLIRRLAGLVFVALGVSFITFILAFWGAGRNGELAVIAQCGNRCTPDLLAHLEDFYHLRDPWYQQFAEFLNRVIHGSLGYSYANRERAVNDILASGVPISVTLQLENYAVQVLLGVPIGIIAALRAASRFDTTVNGISLLFYALPSYLLIVFFDIVTVYLAQHNLPHLPVSGWNGPFALTAVAPVTILAAIGIAYLIRLTRTSMLEVLGQDYIRTARAKGLRERVVIFRHGFRNAMIPLVTALGPLLAYSVSGAFFTETLFQIPGIGYAAVQSITSKDLPVLQGTVLIGAIAVVVMNLVADVVYGILDPRIKVA
jgi:ABC-type dipeptide/oligopeptide/nickel transport system permease component